MELVYGLGGATDRGYVYATRPDPESVRCAQQARLDVLVDRFEKDREANATQRLVVCADKDNVAIMVVEAEQQRHQAHKLHTVNAKGRSALGLQDSDARDKTLPDLPLLDGDDVYMSRKPGTVEVSGSVFQQNSFIYRARRIVRDYLTLRGVAVTMDQSDTYLLRIDGTILLRMNPGDAIVVSEKMGRAHERGAAKAEHRSSISSGLMRQGFKCRKANSMLKKSNNKFDRRAERK